MDYIDLHVHSDKSDGTVPPVKLVQLASERGLSAFALTDHDNTDGLIEAFDAASRYNIEVIPGIEFSTEYHGIDVHIVGLEFEWENPAFQTEIMAYRQERLRRNQKMIDKMAADGIDISLEKMEQAYGKNVWTRANFARYLADHGYAREIEDAFHTYVSETSKYFIPRQKISPFDAIKLIRRFNGIPVLAHPFQYHLSDEELITLIKDLKNAGLIGLEAYYSTYNEQQTSRLLALAGTFDLAPSGGSDFHGTNKPHITLGNGMHNLQIPYTILKSLRDKLKASGRLI